MKCVWCREIIDDNLEFCPKCGYKEGFGVGYNINNSLNVINNESEKYLYHIKGKGGNVYLYNKYIILERKGLNSFFLHGLKGDKQIPIKNITAIQLKKPGFTSGYIQFSVLGGNENGGGILSATKDENTIIFVGSDNYEIATKIQTYINDYSGEATSTNHGTVADELLKISNLYKEGLISEDEFNKLKSNIINK